MLSDPKIRFCVTVFLPMMDILCCQLINHFEGMKSVVRLYQVLQASFLSKASHLDLEVKATTFSNKFSDNVSPLDVISSFGSKFSIKCFSYRS